MFGRVSAGWGSRSRKTIGFLSTGRRVCNSAAFGTLHAFLQAIIVLFFPAVAGHYSRTHWCSGPGLRLFIRPCLRRAVSISRPFFWASFLNGDEARFFAPFLPLQSPLGRQTAGPQPKNRRFQANFAIRCGVPFPGRNPEPGSRIVRFRSRHLKLPSSRRLRDVAIPGFHGKGQSCQNRNTHTQKQHRKKLHRPLVTHWSISRRTDRHCRAQSVSRGMQKRADNPCSWGDFLWECSHRPLVSPPCWSSLLASFRAGAWTNVCLCR